MTSETAADDIHIVFELGDAKVDAVVHHLAKSAERLGRYVEQKNLRRRYVRRPVELISLVAADDEDVRLVDDNNLSFADLLIVHFEASPLELFKVVKSVLVKLSEVE